MLSTKLSIYVLSRKQQQQQQKQAGKSNAIRKVRNRLEKCHKMEHIMSF